MDIVVAQLIQHLNNRVNFVAYAGGFSVGTLRGITIENKLKVGTLMVRVTTAEDPQTLIDRLKEAGFYSPCNVTTSFREPPWLRCSQR